MAKEKWITTGMAAVIAIGLLTGCGSKDANADAATNTTKDAASDFEYKEEDGKITITYYKGKSTEIAIPAQIDGKDVTAIGESAFINCYDLAEIYLNEGLQNIKKNAFLDCEENRKFRNHLNYST